MRLSGPTSAIVALLVLVGARAAGENCDLQAGERVYAKCRACHSLEEGRNMMGPSLHGLMGRQAGSMPGFTYSPAFEAAEFVWDAGSLDAFIENPMGFVPGTTMPFAGIKQGEDREALGCYLQTKGG